ncbi:MAG: DUF748 domain-containing protein [Bacteroidota bacterium]
MDKKKKKWRKGLLIGLGTLLCLLLIVVLCLSPILKHIVEKNDEKWFGRQVTIGWVYANPLTGYVHLYDVKFYEHQSDTVFLSVDGISGSFNLVKLFSGEYLVSGLKLTRPSGTVIQYTKERFNFSDIVEKFSDGPVKIDRHRSPTKFSMPDVTIENGTFYLREVLTPVYYFIKDVNIKSTGYRWNVDSIANTFDFNSGIGSGKFEGYMNINTKTSLYHSHIIIRRLDLKIIEQYLKDLAQQCKFKALINLDITAKGDMRDGRNIDAVGGVGIYDFHLGKTETEDFASFKKFVIKINHLNPRKNIYEIDSMSLVEPFARYERYDHLDNFQDMFGVKGSKVKAAAASSKFNLVIVIADYIKLLTRNFFRSNYRVNRVGIYRGNLQYHDYSLNEKFALGLSPLTIAADSLGSNKERARMRLTSGIMPYGNVGLNLNIDPKDSSNFELKYHLEKMNAAVLNPFLLAYTSFPLDRGSIEMQGNWRVRNGMITSTNHILVIDPRLTKRVKANNNKWLPLKLVMFLARDRGNAIDYEIPITGNLKDPKFNLRDVFSDALGNIFIKPATTLYRYKIKDIENKIEKTIGFNWEPGSADLLGDQEKFVKRVARFLQDNPSASIAVFPNYYKEKEEEYIGFYEAKKKYFIHEKNRSARTFSDEDSIAVLRMSPKDSLFNLYMRHQLNDSAMRTTQQLCRAFAGPDLIEKRYRMLHEARKNKFLGNFTELGVRDRVRMQKPQSRVPFNGFSYYQVSYHGDIPESMKEAFEELREFDNEPPRKSLKEKRNKTRKFFNAKKRK